MSVWEMRKLLLVHVLVLAALCGCSAQQRSPKAEESIRRQQEAMALFTERCKKAGEFIHRTADGVDGILLLKVRPDLVNDSDQFALTDPYGHDFMGEAYIRSFLRGHYQHARGGQRVPNAPAPLVGYEYVDVIDPTTKARYRYTGSLEEPWQKDKSFLQGYIRFVSQRGIAESPAPRYAVTYDDISTREDREYWIAGSSLKVIDLAKNEVIAERVGYAVDLAQGDRSGGRAVWLWALDNACPSLVAGRGQGPAFPSARYRAARFTERVLRPAVN